MRKLSLSHWPDQNEVISSSPGVYENVGLPTFSFFGFLRASLVAQLVKNLPAMQETWVRSLGWEDPLEMGTARLLAWRIPWTT